jgi:hypothetical protein
MWAHRYDRVLLLFRIYFLEDHFQWRWMKLLVPSTLSTHHITTTLVSRTIGFFFALPNSTNLIMCKQIVQEPVRFLGYWHDVTCIIRDRMCIWCRSIFTLEFEAYWGIMSRPSHFIWLRSLNGWKLAWNSTWSPRDHDLLDLLEVHLKNVDPTQN